MTKMNFGTLTLVGALFAMLDRAKDSGIQLAVPMLHVIGRTSQHFDFQQKKGDFDRLVHDFMAEMNRRDGSKIEALEHIKLLLVRQRQTVNFNDWLRLRKQSASSALALAILVGSDMDVYDLNHLFAGLIRQIDPLELGPLDEIVLLSTAFAFAGKRAGYSDDKLNNAKAYFDAVIEHLGAAPAPRAVAAA